MTVAYLSLAPAAVPPSGLSASQIAFYATAATVLPVLILALALAGTVSRIVGHVARLHAFGGRGGAVVKFVALGLLVLMSAGELLSLKALMDDGVAAGTDEWVMAGLTAAWLPVFIDVVVRVADQVAAMVPPSTGHDACATNSEDK